MKMSGEEGTAKPRQGWRSAGPFLSSEVRYDGKKLMIFHELGTTLVENFERRLVPS
jgi:hypothetical protein